MRLIDADALADELAVLLERNEKLIDEWLANLIEDAVDDAPTVDAEPVEPIEFEWCHDCKEYDQNAHCCHRWTKVIRNTVNELKTQGYEIVRHGYWIVDEDGNIKCSECGHRGVGDNYCENCGAKMEETEDAEIY